MTQIILELIAYQDNKEFLQEYFMQHHPFKKMMLEFLYGESSITDKLLIIDLFAHHLPIEKWLDTDLFKERSIHYLVETPDDIDEKTKLGQICMESAHLRALFSPTEKGLFFTRGITLQNHDMAYCATLDKDWKYNLTNLQDLLIVETLRLTKEFQNYKNSIHDTYINWMVEDVLPKFSIPSQIEFLLSLFGLLKTEIDQPLIIMTNSDKGSTLGENRYNFDLMTKQLTVIKKLLHIEQLPKKEQYIFNAKCLTYSWNFIHMSEFSDIIHSLTPFYLAHKLEKNMHHKPSTHGKIKI